MSVLSGRRVLAGSTLLFTSLAVGEAYTHRPETMGDAPSDIKHLLTKGLREESFVHRLGKTALMWSAFTSARIGMTCFNTVEIHGQHHLQEAFQNRDPEQALITVSNHVSTIDDPCIFSVLLPFDFLGTLRNPSAFTRWGICTQEICFKCEALSAIFGAMHTLPLIRGDGVDQPLLAGIMGNVLLGRWVHIFPEGGTFQFNNGKISSLRMETDRPKHLQEADVRQKGLLKWGVGKLIAKSTRTPVVVPVFHVNMQDIMPQKKTNEKIGKKIARRAMIDSFIPRGGVHISIWVGEPIYMEDLLEDAEQIRGKNKTLKGILESPDDYSENDARYAWASSEEEKVLYSALTMRVQTALQELEAKALKHEMERQQELGLEIGEHFMCSPLAKGYQKPKILASAECSSESEPERRR